MNKIKFKEYLKKEWFWIILFGGFAFFTLKNCQNDTIIERNGVMVTVTVEHYDRKPFSRAGEIMSVGYYYVENKRYRCSCRYKIPKGSTFKIKYNPKNPEVWRCIEE